jgi:hypothetical protein
MKNEDLSQLKITDLTDLWNAISETRSLFENVYPLWRGHANISWSLRAEVFRQIPGQNGITKFLSSDIYGSSGDPTSAMPGKR